MKRQILMFVAGVVSLIVVWEMGSTINPAFFPPLSDIASQAWELSTSENIDGETATTHLVTSLRRILIITALAFAASVIVGIAMGSLPIEQPLSNFLPFWMAFPPLVTLLFMFVLLGFSELTIVVATFLAAAPYGIVNVWKGTNNVDSGLLEMADAFGVSRQSTWREIYFPAVLPHLFSSGRYLFSMVWKVTLTAEVFGVETGVGARIRFWFQQGDLTLLLAYFFIFFIVLLFIEYGLIMQIEKRAFAWRSDSIT